jgi:hypothetical protein
MNIQHTSFCRTQHLLQEILIQIIVAAFFPLFLFATTSQMVFHSFLQCQLSAMDVSSLTRIHDCTTNFNLKVDEELLALQLLQFLDIITLNFLFPLAINTEFYLFCHICFHIPHHPANHGIYNVIISP